MGHRLGAGRRAPGRSSLTCLLLVLAVLLPLHAAAENITQTIPLRAGWNAVFLEVDPASTSCDDVFGGIPNLLSAWTWNSRTAVAEYVQDPDTLIPEQTQWLVYFPGDDLSTNLHAVYGERAYLIHVGGTRTDIEWMVTGEPRLPQLDWKDDSFNLVGFHLEAGAEPLFDAFFSASLAHRDQEVYILDDSGHWELVADPATTRMRAGEAFWVYCGGASEFTGPLTVQLDRRAGLHYGTLLEEQSLLLRNSAAADIATTIELDGGAPLAHRYTDPETGAGSWLEFPLVRSLPAGERSTVRIGTRRLGLTPGQLYTANLTVSDGAGMRIVVPASVEGVSLAGLWVGEACLRKVNEPRVAPDQTFPLVSDERSYAAAAEFSFRLILHVDGAGQVRLLKQAIQVWDEAQGRHVVFSDDAKLALYPEATEGRRISSAAFGALRATEPRFEAPMAGQLGGTLTCAVETAPEDPTNPFRHGYHPDHGDPARAYRVTRAIELVFAEQDEEGASLGWGGTDMGGTYRETLTGLHRDPLRVEGVFLLQKVSEIDALE